MIEAFKPHKFWVVVVGDDVLRHDKSGGILLFQTPAEAGKQADRQRRIFKRGGYQGAKIKVKGVLVLSEMG